MNNIIKNQYGQIKTIPSGFSFTTLFFGWWVPLLRGDIRYTLYMLGAMLLSFTGILAIVWLVAHIYWSAKYNEIYYNKMIAEGWIDAIVPTNQNQVVFNNYAK